MIQLLQPLLSLLGVGSAATNVTMVGMALGLSYGADMTINEVGAGQIPPRDLLGAITLLGLCHRLFEDTLLLLLIGADLSGILWARLLFALLLVGGEMRLYHRLPARLRARAVGGRRSEGV